MTKTEEIITYRTFSSVIQLYTCFSSVLLVCIPALFSHTSMFTCFSSVMHICKSAFPQSYKYVYLLSLILTSMYVCFSSVILVSVSTFSQSYTYVQVHYKSYFTTHYFKSFFTFLLYINGLCFTMHVTKISVMQVYGLALPQSNKT